MSTDTERVRIASFISDNTLNLADAMDLLDTLLYKVWDDAVAYAEQNSAERAFDDNPYRQENKQ